MASFYDGLSFYNSKRSVDLTLWSHLASTALKGESNRVIYSSNEYAMRKRSDMNNGNLTLPFINFKITDNNEGLRPWWNAVLYGGGKFIPEVSGKLKLRPLFLLYEGTYWCNRDDEKDYVFNQMSWDADNKTMLRSSLAVDEQTIDLPALLGYESLNYDPDYDEKDWLERNNIHSIKFNLSIKTFSLLYDDQITIPETVLFNFAKNYGETVIDYDTTMRWLDHVLEEVTDEEPES